MSRFARYFAASLLMLACGFDCQSVATLDNEQVISGGHIEPGARAHDEVSYKLVKEGSEERHPPTAYEPIFAALSRSILGRQGGDSDTTLQNNVPAQATITPGQVLGYVFPSSVLHGSPSTATPIVPASKRRDIEDEGENHVELRKRQNDVPFYLTLGVCSQPSPSSGSSIESLPQLQLFLSFTDPQPIDGHPGTIPIPVADGFASYSNPTSDNVYVQVQALDTPGFSGSYSFELTGSIDAAYAVAENNPSLYYIDSDATTAMLISSNLTDPNSTDTSEIDEWEKLGARFKVAVGNQNNTQMTGLMSSYCAFQNNTQLVGNFAGQNESDVNVGFTTIGGDAIKQQFYVSGLNQSSSYWAVMALPTNYSSAGPGQPGGGGTVWKAMNFTTQSEDNCRVIYNLSFCNEVNYAVPYNPNNPLYQGINLTQWYDNQALNWWANFSNAMDQIACDTTPDAQYSLAVTCEDCKNAYRQWLCAVTIPRCREISSQLPYLVPRAVSYNFTNGTVPSSVSPDPIFNASNQEVLAYAQSRNPWIDQVINPGPYKELLPCGDMCHSLVQTCPAALGFACPTAGKGFNYSYGLAQMDSELPMCNIPGQIWGFSAGSFLQPSVPTIVLTTLLSTAALQLGVG